MISDTTLKRIAQMVDSLPEEQRKEYDQLSAEIDRTTIKGYKDATYEEWFKGVFNDNSITIIVNLEGTDYLVGANNVSKEDFDKKFNKCVNVISKAIKEK